MPLKMGVRRQTKKKSKLKQEFLNGLVNKTSTLNGAQRGVLADGGLKEEEGEAEEKEAEEIGNEEGACRKKG